MLVYPAGLDVSTTHLRFLAGQLRARRRLIGTRWRRLSAGRQALLVLAYLRKNETYTALAGRVQGGGGDRVPVRPRSPARARRPGPDTGSRAGGGRRQGVHGAGRHGHPDRSGADPSTGR